MITYLKYYADLLYYFYKCSIQCLINSANKHLLLMRSRLGTFFYMNQLIFISYIDNFTEIVSGILKILCSPMYIYTKLLCTVYIYNFYCQLHLKKLGKICHSISKYYLSQLLLYFTMIKNTEISDFCSNYDYKYEVYDFLNITLHLLKNVYSAL